MGSPRSALARARAETPSRGCPRVADAPAEPSPFGPGNPERPSHRYLFLRFLRIGFLAWGGPVAQIGLMHREVVERDRWVDETRFRKVLALYQALPGPEAHELAVYFGTLKRGRLGGFLTGLAFMLPGVVLITLLAALYTLTSETTRVGQLLLYGVRPAVIGLLAWGFVKLARRSLATPLHALLALGAATTALLLPALGFVPILLLGGLLALAWAIARRRTAPPRLTPATLAPLLAAGATTGLLYPALTLGGLAALALVGLKAGLLSFGGAYTAIPFLQQGAVQHHAWVTDDQFLDAFALSGLMPAPLIAVGTFVGYLAAGLPGALVATITIFAPAFAFTLLGHDVLERLVDEPRLHEFLLGVTAAVIGLILVASLPLGRAAFVDAWTILLGLAAFGALLTQRIPIPLVLLGAAGLGFLASALP